MLLLLHKSHIFGFIFCECFSPLCQILRSLRAENMAQKMFQKICSRDIDCSKHFFPYCFTFLEYVLLLRMAFSLPALELPFVSLNNGGF